LRDNNALKLPFREAMSGFFGIPNFVEMGCTLQDPQNAYHEVAHDQDDNGRLQWSYESWCDGNTKEK